MNVVIAVDGSPSTHSALEISGSLLAGREVSILLVHVIPEHFMYGKGGIAPAEVYDLPKERAASRTLLDESAGRLRALGVGPAIEVQVAMGDPAESILTKAAEAKADLIILGSRGLNAAQRFLIGSVSTKVVTHAHCAVLVARSKATE